MSKDLSSSDLTVTEALNKALSAVGITIKEDPTNHNHFHLYGTKDSLITKKGSLEMEKAVNLISRILLTRSRERNYFLQEAARGFKTSADSIQQRAKIALGSYSKNEA